MKDYLEWAWLGLCAIGIAILGVLAFVLTIAIYGLVLAGIVAIPIYVICWILKQFGVIG